MDQNSPDTRVCSQCRFPAQAAFRFCPRCGIPFDRPDSRGIDTYRRNAEEGIYNDMRRERQLSRFWRRAITRQYLFGALMLTAPDGFLLFLFSNWLFEGFSLPRAFQFLLLDAAIGMLTVLLITISARRGAIGDLILLGLRMGQISVLQAVGLTPFKHDILNLTLLVFVPILLMGIAVLVFRLHLTGIMDHLSLMSAGSADNSPVNEDLPTQASDKSQQGEQT